MSQITLTLVILLFAVFMQLISVAIPYWVSNSNSHGGLWVSCVGDRCSVNKNEPSYFKALQSLQVLGLFAGILGIVTLLIGKFTKLFRPGVARLLTAVHCIAAGTIILIGIVEYSVKGLSMSACFAMSLFSAFVCGIIGGRLTVSNEHSGLQLLQY